MKTIPKRFVLEGVPKVGFYQGDPRCPEDIAFPAVMRSLLEYLGESDYGCKHSTSFKPGCAVSCAYSFMLGVCGAAFFLSWRPGWHMDNSQITYMSDDPAAPYRRALDSVGYGWDHIGKDEGHDEGFFRGRILESLREKGRPVIAFGIIGPPESCIITGYDEAGDVLIGWSFFQNDPAFNAGVELEPSGCFRKRDWFAGREGLLVISEKHDKPPLGEVYREALSWDLQVARTPRVTAYGHERFTGLAAYAAWAEHLARDDQFPADNEALLRERYQVHDQVVGSVAEARWYGCQFLIGMTERVDAGVHRDTIEELLHAAACYSGEHELMWRLWDLAGGLGNPEGFRRAADPSLRREMASLVLQSRDKDARAADHLERALARWK